MLEFNKPEQVKHIAMLEEMNKKGDFSYVGRKDESTEKFYNGDCAMTTASSGSLANIREYAKFNYGVGMMPYDADAKDAPQNAIIGGASLWVMQGKDKEHIPVWRSSSISSRSQKTLPSGIRKPVICQSPKQRMT